MGWGASDKKLHRLNSRDRHVKLTFITLHTVARRDDPNSHIHSNDHTKDGKSNRDMRQNPPLHKWQETSDTRRTSHTFCLSDVTSCLNQRLTLYGCTHGCAVIPNRRRRIGTNVSTKQRQTTTETLQPPPPTVMTRPVTVIQKIKICTSTLSHGRAIVTRAALLFSSSLNHLYDCSIINIHLIRSQRSPQANEPLGICNQKDTLHGQIGIW